MTIADNFYLTAALRYSFTEDKLHREIVDSERVCIDIITRRFSCFHSQ